MSMTAGTIEYPFRQGHLLPMSTLTACLTRIGRIDFDELASSFFRFGVQLGKNADHEASTMLLARQWLWVMRLTIKSSTAMTP